VGGVGNNKYKSNQVVGEDMAGTRSVRRKLSNKCTKNIKSPSQGRSLGEAEALQNVIVENKKLGYLFRSKIGSLILDVELAWSLYLEYILGCSS